MQEKIGVLLPQSNAHPLIGKSFIRGLKLGLGDANPQLVIESIGFGADVKQIINVHQKLSFQEDVVLTTGIVGHHEFADFAHYISKNEDVLLAASLGATPTMDLPSGVFMNSLGLRNSLKSLVAHLHEKGVKTIGTSSCYYEAGYGFITALEEALDQFEDMSFAGHYITPLHPREDEAKIMLETFQECQPDAIIGFHNGVYAEEHADFLKENGVADVFPYYCLPFSFDEKIRQKYPEIAAKVKLVSNWFLALEKDENQIFIRAYEKAHKVKPDFFSLLGYENGLVIAEALSRENEPVAQRIEESSIEGPRGKITFDARETAFEYALWEQNPISNDTVSEMKKLSLLPNSKNIKTIDNQGWYNAYLCH